VLETNTIPGMTATSLFPQAAQKAGMSFSQVLDKLIELGLEAR
jgi:D-alanine-D-alanine ligase